MTHEVRAVLWDLGGVLVTSPFEAFARYEQDHGLPSGLIRRINATNPDDNAWARLERSEVDMTGFAELFEAEAAELGHEVDATEIIGLLSGELRPRMVEALRRLKDRFALAMLTNNFVTADGRVDRENPMSQVLSLFDVVVESSRAGVRKPDPAFYELALSELGVDAGEAVFLDDLGVNLKPARAMGMTTIKVVDPDEALAELGEVVGMDLLARGPSPR